MTAELDKKIVELRGIMAGLEQWRGVDPLPHEAAHDLARAQRYFRDVWLPGAESWCVVKHYADEHLGVWSPVVWGAMAFADRERAEEWADFLGDYYNQYGDRFEVERAVPRSAFDHTKDDDRPVGIGYNPGDRGSRKPMERWRWANGEWVRIEVKAS